MSVLDFRGISKRYGDFVALDEVNLDVKAGECFGLIGPNGAGKSTLMRIAAGILTRFGGQAEIFNLDIRIHSKQIKQRTGYLPEEPSLYSRPRARDLLKYFLRIYGVRDGVEERVDETLKLVGLQDRANDRVEAFSKGMRQRLAIARALIHRPDFLLLDEPTMGLDPATADRVRKFISDQRELQRTIMICTHYMEEAELLCDRVAIIDQGNILALGPVEEVKELGAGETGLVEVEVRNTQFRASQLSIFDGYRVTPRGIIGQATLEEAFRALKENEITNLREVRPTLKDSFIRLTQGDQQVDR